MRSHRRFLTLQQDKTIQSLNVSWTQASFVVLSNLKKMDETVMESDSVEMSASISQPEVAEVWETVTAALVSSLYNRTPVVQIHCSQHGVKLCNQTPFKYLII